MLPETEPRRERRNGTPSDERGVGPPTDFPLAKSFIRPLAALFCLSLARLITGRPDPDIEVVCRPHVSVDVNGVAADEQEFSAVPVEQLQELFEVAR